MWLNTWKGMISGWTPQLHKAVQDYLVQNDQWVRSQWDRADQVTTWWSNYWHHVKLAYLQAQVSATGVLFGICMWALNIFKRSMGSSQSLIYDLSLLVQNS